MLVVAESFLPQINGVTNSVRRVLEHLAAEGHEAELVAPTGPATYAGFPVTRARGASLPVLQGLPDRARDPAPAALGDACGSGPTSSTSPRRRRSATRRRKAAAELGIPTVAIYQTDLVGFAERYDIPGGVRAMAALTRKIHTRGRPHPGAVVGQPAPARASSGSRAPRCGRAVSTCRPSTPVHRSAELRPRDRARRPAAGRLRRPARPREGARAADPPRRRPPLRAGDRRRRPRGAAVAHPAPRGALPRRAARRRAQRRPTPRSTSSCTPGGTRPTASPPRRRWPPACRSSRRGRAGRSTSSPTGWPGSSTSRVTAPTWRRTSTSWPPTRCCGRRMGLAARRSVAGRSWAVGQRAGWSSTTATRSASGSASALLAG